MTAIGMPLAYFGTFLVLSNLGISFDLISLIGMIIVVGMLVDDAIIVSESYTQLLEQGFEPREAAIESAAKTPPLMYLLINIFPGLSMRMKNSPHRLTI